METGRLTFLTRRDCHLCHQARAVVERVVRDHSVTLEVLDVDSRTELLAHYGAEVPVLLVEGVKAFKFRVDEERLRRKLRPWRRNRQD